MKKIHFGVIKIKKWAINLAVILIVGVVAGFAVIAGFNAIPTTAVSGVYYTGDKNSNNVTLMINVYWGTEFLDDMLQILDEKNVKTTFFIGGTWAVMNEELLRKIYEEGHATHTIIKELIGVDMNLFAPPSGAYDKLTVSCASQLGYKTIMWTRDTIDWRDHDENLIYNRAIKNASGGDLILMHPTEATVKALPKIIDYFQSHNFNLTTVSENIGDIIS